MKGTGRLEAFSDGVMAIIITIVVLELKVPRGDGFAALLPLIPVGMSYVLSFVFVGIYWNNHHHLLHLAERVDGAVLWANLHLLFWLSLVPFVTGWMGENSFTPLPTAAYGIVLFMSGISFMILVSVLKRQHGADSLFAQTVTSSWKNLASLLFYALAIGLSFWKPWVACALYALVAMIWLIPDQRVERAAGTSQTES